MSLYRNISVNEVINNGEWGHCKYSTITGEDLRDAITTLPLVHVFILPLEYNCFHENLEGGITMHIFKKDERHSIEKYRRVTLK